MVLPGKQHGCQGRVLDPLIAESTRMTAPGKPRALSFLVNRIEGRVSPALSGSVAGALRDSGAARVCSPIPMSRPEKRAYRYRAIVRRSMRFTRERGFSMQERWRPP